MTLQTALRACFLASIASLGTALHASAQCQQWSPDFAPAGTDDVVNALASYDDGSGTALYAAGNFSYAGASFCSRIARWNGTTWQPLSAGMNSGSVLALAAHDDGSGAALYAGGTFSIIGTTSIARWNGTAWSALAGGIAGSVRALAVFDEGSGPVLFAGGVFSTAGGTSASNLARWNGSSWSAVGGGTDGAVDALTVFDDGTGSALYAAGKFHSAGGTSALRIARWNGTSWSALAAGFDGEVLALCSFDDGSGARLCAGGGFTGSGATSAYYLAAWDGTNWSALGTGIYSPVEALASFDSGRGQRLFVGCPNPATGGSTALSTWDGSAWSTVPGSLHPPASQNTADVRCLMAFDDGSGSRLIAGGSFDRVGELNANFITSWDGSAFGVLGHGQSVGGLFEAAAIGCSAVFDDGAGAQLYVAGVFNSAGNASVQNLARWNGSSWSAVSSGETIGTPAELLACDLGSGAALYACGSFSKIGGVPAAHIARWDGTTWSPLGSGIDGVVLALARYDDGSGPALYAGGSFGSAGGVGAACLARWDGSSWSAVDTGLYTSNFITALAVHDDGSGPALYVSCNSSGDGGYGLRYLSRWQHGVWSNVGIPPVGESLALVSFDDGSGPALYAAGAFTQAGGITAQHIARWNGANWSALGSGTSTLGGSAAVRTLAIFDDGDGPALYAGGDFTLAGGIPAQRVARWRAGSWSALDTGLSGNFVASLAVYARPGDARADLFALGDFSRAGAFPGVPSRRVARWEGCGRPGTRVCSGDGSIAACPCANSGLAEHGCDNSAATGGASLLSAGWTSLANDSLVLTSSGELSNALSIFLQGDQLLAPVPFGDGLRCAGGALKRLYVKAASSGVVSAPQSGDIEIAARSSALGDEITSGSWRVYQVYYRDPSPVFCAAPAGNTWNVSSGLSIGWLP